MQAPAQVTENDAFELDYALDNTDAGGKAVYNVDTGAMTITASSGGQSLTMPFKVARQTQGPKGLVLVLRLVAVKPSPDPRVVFLVQAPTTWQTDARRRSGPGAGNATESYSQVVKRRFVLNIKAPAEVLPSTAPRPVNNTTAVDPNTGSAMEVPQAACVDGRSFVTAMVTVATSLFATQVVATAVVAGCIIRALRKTQAARSLQHKLDEHKLNSSLAFAPVEVSAGVPLPVFVQR
mgnify:CR=1 FL=1